MNDKTGLIIAIVSTTLVMALLTLFIIYFIVIYRKKQRAFEWEREAFKQALLKTEVEIKEQTLSDISRELHDNLGQIASLIKINLNLVSPELPEADRQKIAESLELLKQLITDIKSLSVSLKGENLQRFGLLKMIEKDCERYEKVSGLKVDVSVSGEMPKFEPAIEIFLYRMSQEIFNNILKHAKATNAGLIIAQAGQRFVLKITDNGKGFDTNVNHSGAGLSNLGERCRMIGAKLEIKSSADKGTTVEIEMKL